MFLEVLGFLFNNFCVFHLFESRKNLKCCPVFLYVYNNIQLSLNRKHYKRHALKLKTMMYCSRILFLIYFSTIIYEFTFQYKWKVASRVIELEWKIGVFVSVRPESCCCSVTNSTLSWKQKC